MEGESKREREREGARERMRASERERTKETVNICMNLNSCWFGRSNRDWDLELFGYVIQCPEMVSDKLKQCSDY